ncbi:MAG TPA: helix-turn-helix domain-containing protein [Mobilitalea sp.]|nr:helix-turn-helix domain-containing protein [Mobilitalea sp.]
MKANDDRHEVCHMRDKCLKYDVCPMALVQNMLSGKRKIIILWYLSNKTLRFNDIKRKLPDVTQKMLTSQLRSLEKDGLITRTVYPDVPPKVEYSLTPLGKKIIPILELMHGFGAEYLEATTKEAEPQEQH